MAAVLAAVLVLVVVRCTEDTPEAGPTSDPPPRAQGGQAGEPVPRDLAQAFTATLDDRAEALRERDRRAFLAGVDRSNRGFLVSQRGYFANLAQLPLQQFTYELDRSSMVRAGDQYWVVVEVTLQLEGFDPEPVVSRDRFRFVATEDDRYVVSSVTDRRWERASGLRAQPWDMVPIIARSRPGVLGIFDEESVSAAEPLMESVEQGLDTVAGLVPYDWSRSVVVYALSDSDFLASLDDLPGGDLENLDGVAFPVMAGDGSNKVVATRFALHPSMLGQPGIDRDRLVRHELTHVALGQRDDRAPAWLSEGIAEWVSVQPLAPELRRLPQEALDAAEAGVRGLPRDRTFNNGDAAAHYGLSWWACEYLVASFGQESLWRLLEVLDRSDADWDDRLQELVGLTPGQLARRAARMMINEYDPDFLAPSTAESPELPPSQAPSPTATQTPAETPTEMSTVSPTGAPS
jgi:hypothetical protein